MVAIAVAAYDANTGAPLANASITVRAMVNLLGLTEPSDYTGRTDNLGAFHFETDYLSSFVGGSVRDASVIAASEIGYSGYTWTWYPDASAMTVAFIPVPVGSPVAGPGSSPQPPPGGGGNPTPPPPGGGSKPPPGHVIYAPTDYTALAIAGVLIGGALLLGGGE